ncbi:MAG TPA: hypothetical protein VMT69_01925, partial [Kineosporiaceae bacterium]|nr:hypothetical protein [Kineosporiaceae bacterium]
MDWDDPPTPQTAGQAERAQRQAHRARRQAYADQLNAELDEWIDMLQSILVRGLGRRAAIDLARRRLTPRARPLDLGQAARPLPSPAWVDFAPARPGWVESLVGGERRYAERLASARTRFADAQRAHARAEEQRRAYVEQRRKDHNAKVQRMEAEVAEANADLDQWIEGVEHRRRDAVERYLAEVLRAVPLPKDFPRRG